MEIALHALAIAALGVAGVLRFRSGHPLLLFFAVAVAFTYPLAFSLDSLPRNAPAHQDTSLFLWDLWWVKTALLSGQSPLHTGYLFAPHGTALVFHGLALTQALVTLPFQLLREGLGGLLVAYNAVILLSFTVAGWAAYRLALRETGHRMGALFCGLAFTLAPLHFTGTARFHALAIEWLPLFLWALLGVLERARFRDGLLLGLAFVGAFYASIEYAYFLVLASALIGAFELVASERRAQAWRHGLWWRSGLGFAAAALLTLPYWLAFFAESQLSHPEVGHHASRLAPDLLDVVLPDPAHSLFGPAALALREGLGMNDLPRGVGMAWALLLLAGVGIAAAVREGASRFHRWIGIAVVFGALMFGPAPRWLGSEIGWPTPYGLLSGVLPFFEQARMPMRFSALATLALAVLAAHGIARLSAAAPKRAPALLAGAFGLLLFQALQIPLATEPPRVAQAYFEVDAPAGEAALLDWPPGTGMTAEIEGLHQAVHQQKLVQDLPLFLPRVADEKRQTAIGPDIRKLVRAIFSKDDLAESTGARRERFVAVTRRRLARLDLRHVVVRRAEVPEAVYERSRRNLKALEPSRWFEDEDAFLASFD